MKYEFKENMLIQLTYRLMNSEDLNTKTKKTMITACHFCPNL